MVGHLHQPLRLAVAFGPRHAEIMGHAGLGIAALLVAHHHHRPAAETAEPADDRAVLGEQPVAGQRREIVDQGIEIVGCIGPVRVTGDLGLLPGRQLGVGLGQKPLDLRLELPDLVGDIEFSVTGQMTKLLDLTLEFGNRLFEIQEVMHGIFLA